MLLHDLRGTNDGLKYEVNTKFCCFFSLRFFYVSTSYDSDQPFTQTLTKCIKPNYEIR